MVKRMKSKRSRACDISTKVRKEVRERDNSTCIWCGKYLTSPQICHYISRGCGGLGITQNLVCGCVDCHIEADQGTHTKEYKKRMKDYLKSKYHNWDEESLRYKR